MSTCKQVLVGVLPEVNRSRRAVEVLVPVGGDDEPVTATKPVPSAAAAAAAAVLPSSGSRLSRRRKVHGGEGRTIAIVGGLERVVEKSYAPGGRGCRDEVGGGNTQDSMRGEGVVLGCGRRAAGVGAWETLAVDLS